MIEHNVVVVDGVEYKAVKSGASGCEGCAGVGYALCPKLGACGAGERADGENVRFKIHYRPRYNELPIKVIEL